MNTHSKTFAANQARRIQLARMSAVERRAIGLRLFAIYSGRQTQMAYRARGITNPCKAANEARRRNCARRREERRLRELGVPEPTRSRVNYNW
jgi:hypothetical protein